MVLEHSNVKIVYSYKCQGRCLDQTLFSIYSEYSFISREFYFISVWHQKKNMYMSLFFKGWYGPADKLQCWRFIWFLSFVWINILKIIQSGVIWHKLEDSNWISNEFYRGCLLFQASRLWDNSSVIWERFGLEWRVVFWKWQRLFTIWIFTQK